MGIYKLFDINTATTLKPWGPREEQAWKDIIDTVVVDTIDGTKNIGGHLHGKVYASDSVAAIDAQTSTTLTLNLRDDISSGLLIKNRNGDNIVAVDSSTSAPAISFNCDLDINGNVACDVNYINRDGVDDKGLYFHPTIDLLTLIGTPYSAGDNNALLNIVDDSTIAAGNGGGIMFGGIYNASTGAATNFAGICGYKANGDDLDYDGQLHFQTRATGDDLVTAMIIDENGNVGINTSPTIQTNLQINHTANNTSSLTPTICKQLGLYVATTTPSNTVDHIYSGICMGDGHGGMYGFDDGANGATGLRLFTGNNIAVSEKVTINSDGTVGIGTISPEALVHIYSGNAGIAPSSIADELVIENSDNAGISILTLDENDGFLVFGNPSDSWAAGLRWSYSNLLFRVGSVTAGAELALEYSNGVEAVRIASDGGLVMTGGTRTSQGAGTINAAAVYDDGVILTDYVFEKHYDENYTIPENNEPANTFEKRYEICRTIDTFISFVKNKKCLPAFDDDSNEKMSIGDRFQKLLESVETMVYYLDDMNNRLKALNA